MQAPHRLQRDPRRVRAGGGGQGEGVKEQVAGPDAMTSGLADDAACDGQPALSRLGDALLVQRQRHQRGAIAAGEGKHRVHPPTACR